MEHGGASTTMYEPFLDEEEEDYTIIYRGGTSFFMGFWDWLRKTRWIITSKYIQRETGRFSKTIEYCELSDIRDLSFSPGCSGIGRIDIYKGTSSSSPYMTIVGIPSIERVFSNLRDAISDFQSRSQINEFDDL
ncbi:hypothetical protein QOT17_025163 [Balamuthia mandrillaris]